MTQSASSNPLYVGLAGMGTVGGGLVRLLREDRELIERRVGRDIVLRKVLVRNATPERAALLPEAANSQPIWQA